ncbi:MAG TPA: MFS transporter [Acidobacteriaceae bacterium]|nr:MFS transporter [Acidobacteriaceae bacterium]
MVANPTETGDTARRRIAMRLLPFVFLLYVISYVDRVNVSFANLRMSAELGFSDRIFGLGAGIFFVGYVLFEIPGTIVVERWSARKWMARIMISWGLVTIVTGFVHTAHQFYFARFFLGVAEASFFPGMIVYLTHWFRLSDRARAIASLYAAVPAASVLGSLLAGWLLGIHWLGMVGWRWLFIVEGIPPVVLGVVTWFYLTDTPDQARWLTEDQRKWISRELESETRAKKAVRTYTIWQAIRDKRVWMLIVPYFLAHIGAQASVFWIPTFIKRISGFPAFKVALLVALPGLIGIAGMILNGWHSDKTGERRWHATIPLVCAGICYLLIGNGSNFTLAITLLVVGGGIFFSYYPVFWSMPTMLLSETAAAVCFGLINSIGHIGGFVGPYAVGRLNDYTGNVSAAFLLIAVCYLSAGILLALVMIPRPVFSETTDLAAIQPHSR